MNINFYYNKVLNVYYLRTWIDPQVKNKKDKETF